MTIAFVNETHRSDAAGGTAIALPALAVASNNLLVVLIATASNAPSITSITDTAGNTYASAGADAANPDGGKVYIWYAEGSKAHATDVITVTFGSAALAYNIQALQFSGVRATGALEQVITDIESVTSDIDCVLTTGTVGSLIVTMAARESAAVTSWFARDYVNDLDYTTPANGSHISSEPSTLSAYYTAAPKGYQQVSCIPEPAIIAPLVQSVAVFLPASGSDSAGAISAEADTGSSQITLQDTVNHSHLIGGFCRNVNTSITAKTNTSFDYALGEAAVDTYQVAFRGNEESGGDMVLGGTAVAGVTATMVAIEILGWNTPALTQGLPIPQAFRRRPQPHFYSHVSRPPFYGPHPVTAAEFRGDVVLPGCFARPRWNPSPAFNAKPAYDAPVVPRSPIPPTVPGRFARPRWNLASASGLGVFGLGSVRTEPYAEITVVNPSVWVTVPFAVSGVLGNPGSTKKTVVAVEPLWVADSNEPGAMGEVSYPSIAQMSHAVARLMGRSQVALLPRSTVAFTFGAVIFAPGVEQLFVRVFYRDGTWVDSDAISVTAVPVGS